MTARTTAEGDYDGSALDISFDQGDMFNSKERGGYFSQAERVMTSSSTGPVHVNHVRYSERIEPIIQRVIHEG